MIIIEIVILFLGFMSGCGFDVKLILRIENIKNKLM